MEIPYFYADNRRIELPGVNTETANRQAMAMLQMQMESEKLKSAMQLSMNWQNTFHPVPEIKAVEKTEDKPVKKPKTPFEIRIDLWNTVNEEIAQVEEFLENLTLKQPWIAKFFNVQCYRKGRAGFSVDTGRRMELPAALQEKMIRTAEEYLEELKEQKKDMEAGYND